MGNDPRLKGQTAHGPQSEESEAKESDAPFLFAGNPTSGPKSLAQKVEESLILVGSLSSIQQVILNLIVDGYDTRTIAVQTGLSPETVLFEKHSLLAKLGAQTTTDAVRIGIYAQARFSLGSNPK
jgi:DNA-binding NarL/FixJ family response regulator